MTDENATADNIIARIAKGMKDRAGWLWNRNINKQNYFKIIKDRFKREILMKIQPLSSLTSISTSLIRDVDEKDYIIIDNIRHQLDQMKFEPLTPEGLNALRNILLEGAGLPSISITKPEPAPAPAPAPVPEYIPGPEIESGPGPDPLTPETDLNSVWHIYGFNMYKEAIGGEVFGTGGYGTVYKLKKYGKTFAVKVIHAAKRKKESIEAERNALITLNKAEPPICPRIYIYGVVPVDSNKDTYVIIMDGINGIELFEYYWLKKDKSNPGFTINYINNKQLYDTFEKYDVQTVLEGVKEKILQLHKFGFVHRDIKPENIMIAEVEGKLCVYIVDVGFAVRVNTQVPNPVGTLGYNPYGNTGTLEEESERGKFIEQTYPKDKAVPGLNIYAFNRIVDIFGEKSELKMSYTGGKRLKRRRTTKMTHRRRRATRRK